MTGPSGPRPLTLRSGRLGANLSLETVRLKRVEFTVLSEWHGGTTYTVELSVGYAWERRSEDCVSYEADLALSAHPGDEDAPLLSVLAQFELIYGCPPDLSSTQRRRRHSPR